MKAFLRKYFTLILLLLVVLLAGLSVYFYKKASSGSKDATASIKEATTLSRRVSRIMVLPEGETPTIATVSDPEALRDQPFFVDAKVGDKVLIYADAKKAILFDPKAGKIINVAPLNAGSQPSTTPSPESTTPAKR